MAGGAAAGMIDVHFHLIPQFYREAVYEAGTGPAIGRYPDWTPELALELMDKHWIALAMLSLGATGRRLLAARQGCALRPPLQRLLGRADRAASETFRLLRSSADARHRRGDRGSALLPRNVALRGHFAVRELRRKIPRRRRVRSAAGYLDSRRHGGPHPSRACIRRVEVARSAVAGFHDRISVRHHARGNQSVVLRRARAFYRAFVSSSLMRAARCPIWPGGYRWRR